MELSEREKDGNLRTLQLMKESNLTITQINGQRRLGPPVGWTGPPPSLNCEVFVGKVPRTVIEADLYPVFRRIGEVYEMRLMMDFSGMTRGYCFVMYTNPEDAARAARELNHIEIVPGKKIGVVPSLNNCRLYVGFIPPNIKSKIVIQKTFKMTNTLEKVSVFRQRFGSPVFALLYFKTHRDAAIARRKLQADFQAAFLAKHMIIEWAYPCISPSNVLGIIVVLTRSKKGFLRMAILPMISIRVCENNDTPVNSSPVGNWDVGTFAVRHLWQMALLSMRTFSRNNNVFRNRSVKSVNSTCATGGP